jgi:hypothetical protein
MAPASVTRAEPNEARELASALVASLAEAEPQLLRLNDIALAGALEQQLFFALRDGMPAPGSLRAATHALALGRATGATVLGTARSIRRSAVGADGVLVLIREPTHDPVVAGIAGELAGDGIPLAVLRSGRAASMSAPQGLPSAPLAAFVDVRSGVALWRLQALLAARTARATGSWPQIVGDANAAGLRAVLSRELPRIALGAAALAGAVRVWRPRVLVAFDEVGTWARLLPAVAQADGVVSLDLPHAEAADAAAIRGAGYDRMAVYGARAAGVLRAAGVEDHRIVEIGAPRFDRLVQASRHAAPAAERRKVVFAAQYETGRMTRALLEATQRAAFEVARAVAPAELVLVPHPAAGEPVRLPEPQAGVGVRLAPGGLHHELLGAWLLITGWSNSVFEAAIAGVPAMTVAPPGTAPVAYASDGLALDAADPPAAVAEAMRLLDPEAHRTMVERARAALESRLGPLDGAATERAAGLVRELIGGPASAGT